jgi:hypothetical protein
MGKRSDDSVSARLSPDFDDSATWSTDRRRLGAIGVGVVDWAAARILCRLFPPGDGGVRASTPGNGSESANILATR